MKAKIFKLIFYKVFVFVILVLLIGCLFILVNRGGSDLLAAPPAGVSLAGVHYYGGILPDEGYNLPDGLYLPDMTPYLFGKRGWNITVVTLFQKNGSGQWVDMSQPNQDINYALWPADRARVDGLINIIRIDYRQDTNPADPTKTIQIAVPTDATQYNTWADAFIRMVKRFKNYNSNVLATIFIVGNEPNLDCYTPISAQQYAQAFNNLWSRKNEMPGIDLLAVFNSPFNPPEWMYDMTSRLIGADGFAIHTGGLRPGICTDPRQPCPLFEGWFDGGFRFYRDVISQIDQRFWNKPVYITEFNTYTGTPGQEPAYNYNSGWIRKAFEEVRNYNAKRNGRPEIKALCWFTDEDVYEDAFALRYRDQQGNWHITPDLIDAIKDLQKEFRDAVNRQSSSGVNPFIFTCVRGTDNNIWYRVKTIGNWSDWIPIGSPNGGATSAPSSVCWGENRIDVFVRGSDYALWHKCYANGIWSNWYSLGGYLLDGPDAASWSWGELEVFVRGSDNKIYQKRCIDGVCVDDSSFSDWISEPHGPGSPPGGATSNPSVVSWGSGRLDLFVRGSDNALWHRAYFRPQYNGWGPWESFGGYLTTGPDAASWGAGHFDVFVAQTAKTLWRLKWDYGSYNWEKLPDGATVSKPGAVSPAANWIDYFARGTDNKLYHRVYLFNSWSPWDPLEGVLTSGPDAASWSLR